LSYLSTASARPLAAAPRSWLKPGLPLAPGAGARFEEHPNYPLMTPGGRPVKRREAAVVLDVGVRPPLEEKQYYLSVPLSAAQ